MKISLYATELEISMEKIPFVRNYLVKKVDWHDK